MKTKVIIIIGAIALTIVLYFQSTQIVSKKEAVVEQEDFFTRILSQAKSSLKREELEPITRLEAGIEKASGGNNPARAGLLDSIAHLWQRLQVPAIAAHYFDEKATVRLNSLSGAEVEKNEMEAAGNYYEAFSIAGDTALKSYLIQGAIRNYEKVIAQNPDNLDAKSDLALCYAEGTNNPMQGIMLLREVVAKNPKHENAQFNLGILSVKSGQLQKAIERFTNVIEINPSRFDVYLFRGSTYMRLNDKEKALKDFEKVKNESGNAEMESQADNYINQLKSSQ